VTLPAGTYRFQLASTQTSLHAVQVLSQDGKKLFVTFPTVPDVRASADTPRETVVMFNESAPGVPQAIREWFYAGNPAGEQFVYPKRQAMLIAKANRTTVLATDDKAIVAGGDAGSEAKVSTGPITAIDENGNPAREPNESRASTVPREETRTASANTAPPAPAAAAQTSSTRTLPQTGSNLALLQLLSALCIVGGLTARQIRRLV